MDAVGELSEDPELPVRLVTEKRNDQNLRLTVFKYFMYGDKQMVFRYNNSIRGGKAEHNAAHDRKGIIHQCFR